MTHKLAVIAKTLYIIYIFTPASHPHTQAMVGHGRHRRTVFGSMRRSPATHTHNGNRNYVFDSFITCTYYHFSPRVFRWHRSIPSALPICCLFHRVKETVIFWRVRLESHWAHSSKVEHWWQIIIRYVGGRPGVCGQCASWKCPCAQTSTNMGLQSTSLWRIYENLSKFNSNYLLSLSDTGNKYESDSLLVRICLFPVVNSISTELDPHRTHPYCDLPKRIERSATKNLVWFGH